jgi:uncharacterized protein (DUF58 family)
MAGSYLPLLALLIILAAVFRDDFSFTLLYVFAGSYVFGTWWTRRAIASIRYRRSFSNRVFLGERVQVALEVSNSSLLPVPWVRLHEGLPVELSGPESYQRITSIGPKASRTFQYEIDARRRGYYPVGPVFFSSADLLGFVDADIRREGQIDYLTVYPKIVPLSRAGLPSRSPLGNLRHHQPVFEDPTRVMGKRDYTTGDSLRRIDWKTTAATGKMQVKVFEPSIALETVIFLDLDANDYYYRSRIASTELAIVIAASMANWVVEKQGAVGLYAHGLDPLDTGSKPPFIPARPGRNHLMRILDVLARIKVEERKGFVDALREQRLSLPWGTTLTIISGSADEQLLQQAYQARRSGLSVILILAGTVLSFSEIQRKAGFYGIPVVQIAEEEDLDIWRG